MLIKLKDRMKKMFFDDSGFTLIEMSLVLFIISVLLLLIIPNIGAHQGTAQETGNSALETVVQTQIDLYEMERHESPNSIEDLRDSNFLSESQYTEVKELFSIDTNGNLIVLNGE